MKDVLSKRTWFGVIIILIGLALLLDNLDVLDFRIPGYLFSWKVILILIGAAMMASGRKGGIVLIIIGGLFLLPDIFHIPEDFIRDWWPVLLIILGVIVILRKNDPPSKSEG